MQMIERRAVAQSLGRYLEDSQEDTLVHLCTRAAPARGCTPLEGLGLLGEKMQDHLRAAASQEPIARDAGEATQASKRRRLQTMGYSVQAWERRRGVPRTPWRLLCPSPRRTWRTTNLAPIWMPRQFQSMTRAKTARWMQLAVTARRSLYGLPRSQPPHRSWPGSAEPRR